MSILGKNKKFCKKNKNAILEIFVLFLFVTENYMMGKWNINSREGNDYAHSDGWYRLCWSCYRNLFC